MVNFFTHLMVNFESVMFFDNFLIGSVVGLEECVKWHSSNFRVCNWCKSLKLEVSK